MPQDNYSLIKEDKEALDWLSVPENRGHDSASSVASKLGVDGDDLDAWNWASSNPKTKEALAIRNKIYDKVESAKPGDLMEQGGSSFDRFLVKNFLDNDIEQQRAYYENKGYQTRVTHTGDLQVKSKTDTAYKPIDLEGLDTWDVTDFVYDVAGGLAIAAGAGIGGAAHGPAGMVAGAAMGGMMQEVGKQAIANVIGLRKDYNYKNISDAAILGSAAEIGGQSVKVALGGLAKIVSSVLGDKLKGNYKEIIDATKAIGAPPTSGQLYESRRIKEIEDMQKQVGFRLGGREIRRNAVEGSKASREAADALVSEKIDRTNYEIGQEIETKIRDRVAAKLEPAETIYQGYEDLLGDVPLGDSRFNVFGSIDGVLQDFRMSPKVRSQLNQYREIFDSVKEPTLRDLKQLRTQIGSDARTAYDQKEWSVNKALNGLYQKLTDSRSAVIESFYDGDTFSSKIARDEIKKADSIYRETISDVSNLLGKKMQRGGVKTELESWLGETKEVDRAAKIFRTNDIKSLLRIKESFPDVYELARSSKISEIAERSEYKGEVSPQKLAKIIDSLEPESAELLFGKDGATTAKNLKIYLDSLPPRSVGPSGTPSGQEGFRSDILSTIFTVQGWLDQFRSVGRSIEYKIRTSANPAKEKTGLGKYERTALGAGVLIPRVFEEKLRDFEEKLNTRLQGEQ